MLKKQLRASVCVLLGILYFIPLEILTLPFCSPQVMYMCLVRHPLFYSPGNSLCGFALFKLSLFFFGSLCIVHSYNFLFEKFICNLAL
jgi:hypothetical protein